MPKVKIQQTNFTAGEISPRLIGRVDIDRYGNAAALVQNAYPVIHGGAKRRYGTRYVAEAQSSSRKTRLVPFIASRDTSYMIVLGHSNLRVYPKGGGVMLAELATSYTESMIWDVDYAQGEDTMFLFHPSVPIQRLRRFSDSSWDLSAAPFTTTPFEEQGYISSTTLTLSSKTVGTGRTFTASAGVFQLADVGRQIISGAGAATITGYTSSTQVTATITIEFASTSISGGWYMDVSPQGFCVPTAKESVGASITLNGALTRAANLTLTDKTGSITINADASVFVAGDTGKYLYADTGVVKLTYVSGTQCTGTTSGDFIATEYPTGAWGITDSVWRASDVGNFVRINGGLCKITAVAGTGRSATATIVTALSGVVAAPPFAWSIEQAVWSSVNGYPRTGTLHEQRLVVAGSSRYPQTIWGSRTGEYLDFTKGTADNDAYSFTIAADEVNPISFLASLRNLVVHTYGGEFSLQGGIEKPITPTNVRIKPESFHGSKGVRPVTIGKESVFVQRAGRKVRAMGYRYDFDGYASPDIAVLADHITTGGIVDMTFQQEPDMLLWSVRGDGALLSCTLDRDQQVTGWARHYTNGAVESVATIPNGDRDETWLLVRRKINGTTKRYVEILDGTFAPMYPEATDPDAFPPVDAPAVYGYTVDCGAAFDNASGQSTFSVPHLAGMAVAILADGAVMPGQTADGSGNVTLSRTSKRTLIGLPFETKITMLTPEVGTPSGTAQGGAMRTSKIQLRLLDTVGCKVEDSEGNRQIVPFRNFGADVLDQPPEAFTGLVDVEKLGWDEGKSTFSIIQDQPLPLHLLAVIRSFTVND